MALLTSLFLLGCERSTNSPAHGDAVAQPGQLSQSADGLAKQSEVAPIPVVERPIDSAIPVDQTEKSGGTQKKGAQETFESNGRLIDSTIDLPLNSPSHILFHAGHLYVADTVNDLVRKANLSNGVMTAVAKLERPVGLAASGNDLFVGRGSMIVRIDIPSGAITDFVGSRSPGTKDGLGQDAQFDQIGAMAIAGNILYVVDSNAKLRKVETSTRKVSSIAKESLNKSTDCVVIA